MSAADRQHREIMDRIEQSVRLPAGAAPLQKYARYYAWDKHGDVSADFFMHDDDEMPRAKAVAITPLNHGSSP